MGPETKKQALEKLHAVVNKIGYPDKWRDYSSVEIKRADFVGNVQRATMFESRRELAKIGKPLDRGEWGMTPPTVNAYYDPQMNNINFPAGILQPPFFDPNIDPAVNFGGIGVVIGHEMTHGFDDQGSKFDAQGNLRDWWTEADRKAYTDRTDLMVRQFDGYRPFEDTAVNGKLTLGENIADLGGLKLAWAALQHALGQDPNAAPPQDGFTPGQRFFLAYATVWENNIREQQARMLLTVDAHSPGKWRVDGPLSNLPEFFAAFSCPEGAPMRRPEAERPEIW
jgi:putative endopeptidase